MLRKLKCPSCTCKLEVPQPCSGMDYTISFLHMPNYKIIPITTPQLKSKPMFMNKVAVPAAPLEKDEVVTGCGPATSTANPNMVFTTLSGPNMTMKANIKFQPE
jgi:hypothetical protein